MRIWKTLLTLSLVLFSIVPNLYSIDHEFVFKTSAEGNYVYNYTTEFYNNNIWNPTTSSSVQFNNSLYIYKETPLIRYLVTTNAYGKVLKYSIKMTPLKSGANTLPYTINITRDGIKIPESPSVDTNGNNYITFSLNSKPSGTGSYQLEVATLNLHLDKNAVANASSGIYTSTVTFIVEAK